MVPTSPNWSVRTVRFGFHHSWWLPGTPVDAEHWDWSKARLGYSTLPLRHKKVNGKYKSGGPWNLYKCTIVYYGNSVRTFRYYGGLAYSGRYHDFRSLSDWASFNPSLTLEQAYKDVQLQGAEALAAMRPAKPSFDGLNALWELREVPGALKNDVLDFKTRVHLEQLSRIRGAKGNPRYQKWIGSTAGEWYLSIQFGWVALVRDISSFAQAYYGLQKRVDQLIRDAGKPVRRRRFLGESTLVEDLGTADFPDGANNPYMRPVHVSQCYAPGWGYRATRTTTVKTWCVGQARYYLPDGPSARGNAIKLVQRIYGLRFTPKVLYNMVPWSWFFDYFGQLGSFMEAISGGVEDRLIWDYAYVMRHTKIEIVQELYQHTWADVGSYPNMPSAQRVTSTTKITYEFKTRARASIFGFGVKEEDLTPPQLAIMGALGLSKL